MGEPMEDLISTTADALDKYHKLKLKKKLESEHADIGRFGTADQFLDVVTQYQLPEEEKPEDRGKFKELYRDAQLIVVELLDVAAAQWWGQGAQWCTNAKKNNMFSNYHERGPLYVIIPRQEPGVRYQLWWNRQNPYRQEFKDVKDQNVAPNTLSFFPLLQTIISPLSSHIMWKANPTPAEQLAVVKHQVNLIQHIANPTEEVQLIAVKYSPDMLQWIKNPTEDAQLAAVEKNGRALRWIENPTKAVQRAAIEQNGRAIYYITDPSPELQLAAVQQNSDAIRYINNPSKAAQKAAIIR